MGIISNRIDRSLLKRGDHIYCYRNVHVYSHHGIYIGDNRVIHFTRTQDRTEDQDGQKHIIPGSSSSQSNSTNHSCKDDECVGNDKNNYNNNSPKKALGVVKCCLDCFQEGHRLFRFKYGVSDTRFMLNRSGTCTTSPANGGPEEAVQRATEMLEETLGFGEYNIVNNNCESFAVYCKTGKRVSLQALSLTNKVINGLNLASNSFSVRNIGKTLYNLTVKHKFDMLGHTHNNGLITKLGK